MNKSKLVLLSEKEVAQKYGWSHRSMQTWRMNGGGPPYLKIGRLCKYREEDIEEWLETKRINSTSDWRSSRASKGG